MKHHPLVDLMMFGIGIVVSTLVMWLFTIILNKLNFGLSPTAKKLSSIMGDSFIADTIGGIICFIIMLPTPFTLVTTCTWLEVAHDYLTDGDIPNMLKCIGFNLLCCLHVVFVTKDMKSRRR